MLDTEQGIIIMMVRAIQRLPYLFNLNENMLGYCKIFLVDGRNFLAQNIQIQYPAKIVQSYIFTSNVHIITSCIYNVTMIIYYVHLHTNQPDVTAGLAIGS